MEKVFFFSISFSRWSRQIFYCDYNYFLTHKTNAFKLSQIFSAQNLTQYGNFKELLKKEILF